MTSSTPALPCVRLAAILFAASLSGLALVAPARAQSTPQDGPFDGMMRALDLKAKVAPAPDFVVKSRPTGKVDFLPVGTKHPERADKLLTPAELAATETELDKARAVQQRRAGVKPPPVPDKTKKSAATASTKAIR